MGLRRRQDNTQLQINSGGSVPVETGTSPVYSTTILLVLGLILPGLGQTPTTGGSGGPAFFPEKKKRPIPVVPSTSLAFGIPQDSHSKLWTFELLFVKVICVSFVSHFFFVSFSLYCFSLCTGPWCLWICQAGPGAVCPTRKRLLSTDDSRLLSTDDTFPIPLAIQVRVRRSVVNTSIP